MIDREFNELLLSCDICYKAKFFDNFSDAVDYKKSNGWKSVKERGEWLDICLECVEGSGV